MLLICIAVTMSVLFYAYSAGLLGSLQTPRQSGTENLVIENIAFTADGSAQLTVRNIGTNENKVGSIYVDGVLKFSSAKGVRISIGQAQTFTLPSVAPTQHRFKVATLNGGGVSSYGPEKIFIIAAASAAGSTSGTPTMTTTTSSATITWTSTYQTTRTTATSTTQTLLSTSTTTSTHHGQPKTTITSLTTITSISSGPTTLTLTTSATSTSTTTQLTTRTTTITTTITSSLGSIVFVLFMLHPLAKLTERSVQQRRREAV
jgi:hypothetical protein